MTDLNLASSENILNNLSSFSGSGLKNLGFGSSSLLDDNSLFGSSYGGGIGGDSSGGSGGQHTLFGGSMSSGIGGVKGSGGLELDDPLARVLGAFSDSAMSTPDRHGSRSFDNTLSLPPNSTMFSTGLGGTMSGVGGGGVGGLSMGGLVGGGQGSRPVSSNQTSLFASSTQQQQQQSLPSFGNLSSVPYGRPGGPGSGLSGGGGIGSQSMFTSGSPSLPSGVGFLGSWGTQGGLGSDALASTPGSPMGSKASTFQRSMSNANTPGGGNGGGSGLGMFRSLGSETPTAFPMGGFGGPNQGGLGSGFGGVGGGMSGSGALSGGIGGGGGGVGQHNFGFGGGGSLLGGLHGSGFLNTLLPQPQQQQQSLQQQQQQGSTTGGIDGDIVIDNLFPSVAWLRGHDLNMYRWAGMYSTSITYTKY